MGHPFGLRKIGTWWHVDFRVAGQHVHRSTRCSVYPDALDVATRLHSELTRKAQGLPVDLDLTVAELWARWWAENTVGVSEAHRNRVEQDWRLHVLPAWGERLARTITTADAEALRKAYLEGEPLTKKGRSVAGGNKLLLHAHLVWAWAVKSAEVLARVPWTVHVHVVQEKPKDTLQAHQVRRFLEEVDRAENVHVHVAVRAMLYLALREAEALTMRWEWFAPDLTTFQHGQRKAKDAPRFPVPLDLQARLRELVKVPDGQEWERPAGGLVLPRADTEDEARRWGQFTTKAIRRAGRVLGLRLTPHSLRHSWATMTARATGNAHLVKDGLGHSRMETSMKYVKQSTSDLEEAQAAVFGDLARAPKKRSQHSPKPKTKPA